MPPAPTPAASGPATEAPAPHGPAAGTAALRVLSLNLRRLRDSRDAVVRVLHDARPDVVAVQEVTRGLTGRRRMARLAADAGLVHVPTPGGRTTGVLVRPGLPVVRAHGVRLRSRLGRTRRGVAVVDVRGLRVASVHLGLDAAERLRHVDRLQRALRTDVPLVVAGDLNERPGGAAWLALTRHLRDLSATSGPTYPAREPRHRIDVVLGTGVEARTVHVRRDDVARAASDHLPVLVEVVAP
ncbi:endonuclease/exonuclease/phosphatase family protein [Cellulomonas sp. APG4]|uniref:endonuclease/exonuclease/phosphatase family protein n=1 Tax=Cellulomonas sp. APG4 TaxID=1538656 RepID=UPI00192A647A